MRRLLFATMVVVPACAPVADRGTGAVTSGGVSVARSAAPAAAPSSMSPGIEPARGPMSLAEARRFMVTLINRDRASEGLAPVELDEGPPTKAGQEHAEDMAAHGYLGHFGTDGSVPEQRITQAGGADMVLENASCFDDEQTRVLDRAARIDPRNVELAEDMFFHEVPPHDGHRRNILKPWHRKVGVGVAQPLATPREIPTPCFAQEFVDPYGKYAPLPRALRVGATLRVEGTIDAPHAVFAGIGLARADAPKPLSVHELNRRRSYLVPPPYQMYWPPGLVSPIPVKVSGGHFLVDLPLSDSGKPGMYEVSVWAIVPGSAEPTIVGLRTLLGTRP